MIFICAFIKCLLLVRRNSSKIFQRRRKEKSLRTAALTNAACGRTPADCAPLHHVIWVDPSTRN